MLSSVARPAHDRHCTSVPGFAALQLVTSSKHSFFARHDRCNPRCTGSVSPRHCLHRSVIHPASLDQSTFDGDVDCSRTLPSLLSLSLYPRLCLPLHGLPIPHLIKLPILLLSCFLDDLLTFLCSDSSCSIPSFLLSFFPLCLSLFALLLFLPLPFSVALPALRVADDCCACAASARPLSVCPPAMWNSAPGVRLECPVQPQTRLSMPTDPCPTSPKRPLQPTPCLQLQTSS